jgi:hypothetical protein
MPQQPFEIPMAYLKQLNEFTSGGFLLLTFDEWGSPRIMARFDNSAHSMAAQKYLHNWIQASEEAQINQLAAAMMESDSGDSDSDGEGSQKE